MPDKTSTADEPLGTAVIIMGLVLCLALALLAKAYVVDPLMGNPQVLRQQAIDAHAGLADVHYSLLPEEPKAGLLALLHGATTEQDCAAAPQFLVDSLDKHGGILEEYTRVARVARATCPQIVGLKLAKAWSAEPPAPEVPWSLDALFATRTSS